MKPGWLVRTGAGLLIASLAWVSQAGELVSVPTRPGVTQSIYIDGTAAAPEPRWVVVLFAGDDGATDLKADGPARNQGNFLVRTRAYWNQIAALPVVFDAPSDYASGMNDPFRLSDAHVQDVAAVVAILRQKYPAAKIALVGTSRGSISVGSILKRSPNLADAYVLTSPVTVAGRGGPGLSGLSWERAGSRALVVSNRHDGCMFSPLRSAQKMAEANGFDFIAVSSEAGDTGMPGACRANSPHGYLGIENQVLDAINAWLNGAATPAQ